MAVVMPCFGRVFNAVTGIRSAGWLQILGEFGKQLIQTLQSFAAEFIFDLPIQCLRIGRDGIEQAPAVRRQRKDRASLVPAVAAATNEPLGLQVLQYPCQAGGEEKRAARQVAGVDILMICQHAYDSPLLLCQPVAAQHGPETSHRRFPGAQ